jgi:CMP-N-acetylneuraminic acid synthetase
MIAIIPAKKESTGLPEKNIKPFAGVPLSFHTISAAITSRCFSEIVVTSNCQTIIEYAKGLRLTVLDRPEALSTRDTSMIEVVKNVGVYLNKERCKNDSFMLLQPTSPLRTSRNICESIELFKNGSYKSCVSVCENEHSIFKSFKLRDYSLECIFDESLLNKNRQNLEKTYRQNGAIYISSWRSIFEDNKIIDFPCAAYVMDQESSIDIDTIDDFERAERVFHQQFSF